MGGHLEQVVVQLATISRIPSEEIGIVLKLLLPIDIFCYISIIFVLKYSTLNQRQMYILNDEICLLIGVFKERPNSRASWDKGYLIIWERKFGNHLFISERQKSGKLCDIQWTCFTHANDFKVNNDFPCAGKGVTLMEDIIRDFVTHRLHHCMLSKLILIYCVHCQTIVSFRRSIALVLKDWKRCSALTVYIIPALGKILCCDILVSMLIWIASIAFAVHWVESDKWLIICALAQGYFNCLKCFISTGMESSFWSLQFFKFHKYKI